MQQQSNNLEELFQATQRIALQLHNRLDRLTHGHEMMTEMLQSMWLCTVPVLQKLRFGPPLPHGHEMVAECCKVCHMVCTVPVLQMFTLFGTRPYYHATGFAFLDRASILAANLLSVCLPYPLSLR